MDYDGTFEDDSYPKPLRSMDSDDSGVDPSEKKSLDSSGDNTEGTEELDMSSMLEEINQNLFSLSLWGGIIEFLEDNHLYLEHLKSRSRLTFEKNTVCLLNTDCFIICMIVVRRYLRKESPLTQGQLVRILGGDPNDKDLSLEGQHFKAKQNKSWESKVRNNIKPVLGEYFSLLEFKESGEDRPGKRYYQIHPTKLLLIFFSKIFS